ncbi:hypothetical protein B566_EDAN012536 [Ephemera danica]|nr:hypothetical protein B566_EDAN012536 [Ephemera danica]
MCCVSCWGKGGCCVRCWCESRRRISSRCKSWSGVSQTSKRSSDRNCCFDSGYGHGSLHDCRTPVNHCVEAVDGVSHVVDGAHSTIGFHERVRSLHDVSVTCFLLVLVVASDSVRHGVGIRVLRNGVVVCPEHSRGCSETCHGGCVTQRGYHTGVGYAQNSGKGGELKYISELFK